MPQNLLVSRAPSVSCATRLMLSICLIFFYPGISAGTSSVRLVHRGADLAY